MSCRRYCSVFGPTLALVHRRCGPTEVVCPSGDPLTLPTQKADRPSHFHCRCPDSVYKLCTLALDLSCLHDTNFLEKCEDPDGVTFWCVRFTVGLSLSESEWKADVRFTTNVRLVVFS